MQDTEYGNERLKIVFQPVEGKAIPMKAGEVLRIIQVGNGQCVDFNCYNLHDYKERLSVGFTRMHSFRPKEGDFLWSNPPRNNPMMKIVKMPAGCLTDTLHARCNAFLFEDYYGFHLHTNCQDTFATAIGEYRLTPDDVHDAFNLWMDTGWDDQGTTYIRRNSGRKGEYVDLLATMDVLAVPILCGSGDVQPTASFFPKPIEIRVFEASPKTLEMVKTDNEHMRLNEPPHRRPVPGEGYPGDAGAHARSGLQAEVRQLSAAVQQRRGRLVDRGTPAASAASLRGLSGRRGNPARGGDALALPQPHAAWKAQAGGLVQIGETA